MKKFRKSNVNNVATKLITDDGKFNVVGALCDLYDNTNMLFRAAVKHDKCINKMNTKINLLALMLLGYVYLNEKRPR